MATDGGTKAVLAALFANAGLAVTKFLAFLLSGASSMLAEAIHSVADTSNQFLLLWGGRQARREATPEHPFGYSRYRYYYAFLVAIVLFSLGGLFAIYEAVHKFQAPAPITAWHWLPVVVLVVGIGLESYSFRTAIVESNRVRGNASWATFVRKSRSPELPVILLEDAGALLGLVFALLGVVLTLITGNGLWDAAGTAAIGVLLVVIALVLAKETRSMLLGEAATAENIGKIRRKLADAGFVDVIHLRTMHLGPEDILVTAKVAVQESETAGALTGRINGAETAIRQAIPEVRLIYLEPDVRQHPLVPDTDATEKEEK